MTFWANRLYAWRCVKTTKCSLESATMYVYLTYLDAYLILTAELAASGNIDTRECHFDFLKCRKHFI